MGKNVTDKQHAEVRDCFLFCSGVSYSLTLFNGLKSTMRERKEYERIICLGFLCSNVSNSYEMTNTEHRA